MLYPGSVVPLAMFYMKNKNRIFIFQGEASAVPGVARGDELATVIVFLPPCWSPELTLLFRCGSNGLRAMTWTCSFVPGVTARVSASQWVQILDFQPAIAGFQLVLTDSWIVRSQLCFNNFDASSSSAGWWCLYLN